MNKRAGIAVLCLLLAGIGGRWWWVARDRAVDVPIWQGYAEADYVKVGPVQAGRLTGVFVERGDQVAAGAPLFAQDDIADRAARDEAQRQFVQARERLANLQSSGRPTEIRQAEASLADAEATLHRIEGDLARGESLLKGGFATIQHVDLLRAERQSALARVRGLEAALARIRDTFGRPGEITAQRAAMEAASAALDAAEWRLAQRHVAAPVAALVADVLARPGEMAMPGLPVVSLLPPGNIVVRFFVSEPLLSSIHPGDPVELLCDGCPAGLLGEISFISPEAEFTPPVIYSDSSRTKLVYLVEARPVAPGEAIREGAGGAAGGAAGAVRLNPGQPMRVRPAGRATVRP